MAVYLITMAVSLSALFCAEQIGSQEISPLGSVYYVKGKKTFFYLFTFLALFIPAALRYDVGNDYFSYLDIFRNTTNAHYVLQVEKGYLALNSFVGKFTSDGQWALVLCSFITLLLLFVSIKRYSIQPVFSLYLFFTMMLYSYSFSAIRQYLALALVVYGYKYIKSGNFPAFLIITLIASTFHKSVFIMIPLYFLLRLRLKMSHYFILFLIGLLITILHKPILDFVFTFAYSAYDDSDFLSFHISYLNIFQSGLVAAGCLAYYKPLSEKKENIILINASILSIIMYLALPGWLGNALSRITLYLNVYHIFTIPAIIRCEKRKEIRILYTILIVLGYFALFLLLMRSNRNGNGMGVFPYRSIFSRESA